MRIKYIPNNDDRVRSFNTFIKTKFPTLLTEKMPEIFLVAGGDGTMLRAIHDTIDTKIPYLGKAMGTFNFLLNSFDDDERIISELLSNKIKLHTFKSYAIKASLDGKKLGEAVNDVILGEKILGYHSFQITTKNGDLNNFELKGSGICISTPIGSTAFNFNNNGRILPLDSKLLSVTGIVCNRFLNDIVPFNEIIIKSNGAKIYLTNVESEILEDGHELVLTKGSEIEIAFLDKQEFLERRIELGHRYRK